MPTSPKTLRLQASTLGLATSHRQPWRSSDLTLVSDLAATSTPHALIAVASGRSLYAVSSILSAIQTGRPTGNGHAPSARRRDALGQPVQVYADWLAEL